ncbi:MAG: hypothetical protein K0R50_2610 [Eubacterium sp.]|nr:hypothetical protein [Eubacterium sp.]
MSRISKDEWLKIKNQGLLLYIVLHWILLAALPAAILSSLSIIIGLRRWFKYEKLYRA